MKALQVNESLAFERGQDPKSAMDIGISNRLKWDRTHPNGSFLPAEEVIQYLKKPILAKYIIKGLRSQPEWTIDYQVKMLNHIIDNGGSCWLSEIRPLRGIPLKTMSRIFNSLYQKGILVREKIGNRTKIHLNIPKEINESLSFERGQDPKSAMGIGEISKRVFNTVEEASEWCFNFPQICTEGVLRKWPDKVEYFEYDRYDKGYTIPGVEGLKVVKWIKFNLLLKGEDNITLKQAKDIWDGLKTKIKYISDLNEGLNFERGTDPLKSMNIGLKEKRTFNNVEEAAQWAYLVPELYTDNKIKSWISDINWYKRDHHEGRRIFSILPDGPTGILGAKNIDYIISRLGIVKWFKDNIKLVNEPITLIESKDTLDRLEEIIWEHLNVNESLSFERGQDPKSSMNIGMNRRIFENIEDAAQWAYLSPSTYTNGNIKKWSKDINWYKKTNLNGMDVEGYLPETSFKLLEAKNYIKYRLDTMKWFKDNIHLKTDTKELIGLGDCKIILERLEEIIWEHLSVNESLNFERRDDPFKSMNIGLKSKRTFKNIEEVAQWAYLVPEVYTDGNIKKWPTDINFYRVSYSDDIDSPTYLPHRSLQLLNDRTLSFKKLSSRLKMMKWFAHNLHWEGEPIEWGIGLKEAKNIGERLEEIIWEHLDVNESLAFERGGKPLAKMGIGKNYDNPFHNNPDVTNFYKYSLRQDAPVFKQILNVASEILGIEKDKILALDDINLKHSYVGTEDLTYLTPEIGYRIKKGTIEIVNSKGLLLWTLGVDY